MSDLEGTIEQSAKDPLEAESDGQRVRQHSLRDQILADKHLGKTSGAARSGVPIRMFKFRPPGAA